MTSLSQKIFPSKPDLSHKGIFIGALGALIAIICVALISRLFLSSLGVPILVASMGASAVILFAVTSSPMAKPWSVFGGHLVCATIGVICYKILPNIVSACALAVFFSIILMLYLRCLHPPGGATAMAAIIGGNDIHDLGFQFVLTPVALNVTTILVIGLLFQWLIYLQQSRKKPFDQESWWDVAPFSTSTQTSFLSDVDLHVAMQELDQFVDVNTEELSQLFNLAVAHAQTRHLQDSLCSDVMKPVIRVEFATELEELWQLLKTHDLQGAPVVDRVNRLIGIVTIGDFLKHAQEMGGESEQERLKRLVMRTEGHHSNKPEVAGQIMTTSVHSLGPENRISDVISLFRRHRIHHAPIVDGNNKLLGMISDKDLSALRS